MRPDMMRVIEFGVWGWCKKKQTKVQDLNQIKFFFEVVAKKKESLETTKSLVLSATF